MSRACSWTLLPSWKPLTMEAQGPYIRQLHAASKGHLEIARLLLEYGTEKEAANISGLTASQLAAAGGHLAVAELLGGGKRQ